MAHYQSPSQALTPLVSPTLNSMIRMYLITIMLIDTFKGFLKIEEKT
jgi:hypothetical protein